MVSRLIFGGLIGFVVLAASVSAQTVVYVDADATDPPDGSSWCTAYRTLDEALAGAGADTVIRVADGTYTPDPSGLADPREATFQLLNGVTIEGGYAGCGAPDPDARDITANETVLSGNLGNPYVKDDNCYHVVITSGTDATTVLDGVTITLGNANGESPLNRGGGILNEGGSPTLIHCSVNRNWAGARAGGMYNATPSSPTLTDCVFKENTASYGGGMYNSASNPTLTNCTFSENSSGVHGAGMYNVGASGWTMTNCTFNANWSNEGGGGGMYNSSCSPVLTNCTFTGNGCELEGGGGGGGMHNFSSYPTLINCILVGNTGYFGGGMYNESSSPTLINCALSKNGWSPAEGGAMYNYSGSPVLTNCIVWGNTTIYPLGQVYDVYASTSVTYSCVQDGWSGEGNIDVGPAFARWPDDGPDGEWGTPDDDYGDLRLRCISPCLDAGTNTTDPPLPTTDADGNPRIVNGVVDMGPYEGMVNVFVVTPQRVEVPEGASAGFTVALTCDPNGPVSVDVSFESGDPDIAVATPMPLAFDSSNYWLSQTVTLTAAEDTDQLEGSATLAVTADDTVPETLVTCEVENDAPSVLYADASAIGAGDGTSWTDAYPELSDALILAAGAPLAVDEIRVADGPYKPDTSGLGNPREATFQLISDVMIEGGYAGFGAPDPDARDIVAHETILSGDIGGIGNIADNCYHVVTGSGTDATAVLDGVTITAGNAKSVTSYSYKDTGGGAFVYAGSPTFARCRFIGNLAKYFGGGVANFNNSDPTLIDCAFAGNASGQYGGGICNSSSSTNPTLINCTFARNGAADAGGGMANINGSSATLTNCIAWGNKAPTGAQIYNAGGGTPTVSYSCVEDGCAGEGNIDADPAFVRNPYAGADGKWGTADDDYGDLHLMAGSPCVNAGDPNGDYAGQTDMDGEPRVLDGRVDIGADEYSGAAWLVASDPPDGGTLPKTQANVIRLTFSWAIVLPASPALQIEPIGGGADVGDQFAYSLETTSAADDSLKAVEVGSVLVNLTWYRVTPAAGFDVEPFMLDLCVLFGDANGSGRITTADYAEVKDHMGEYTDARYDLNGSGRVTTADYTVVKTHMGDRAP